MDPAGDMVHEHMNAIHANQPVDNADETGQEDVQGRNYELSIGDVRLLVDGHNIGKGGGDGQQIADPHVRKRRRDIDLRLRHE